MAVNASASPMSGESTMKTAILPSPSATTAENPLWPPRRRHFTDEGMGRRTGQGEVVGHQAPSDGTDQAGEDHPDGDRSGHDVFGDRVGHPVLEDQEATKLKKAAQVMATRGESTGWRPPWRSSWQHRENRS